MDYDYDSDDAYEGGDAQDLGDALEQPSEAHEEEVGNKYDKTGIVGIIYVVRIFVKFIGNHMSESTTAQEHLASMIEQMLRWLENNNR